MDRDEAQPIVWIAGVGWDDMPGTDKRMAIALAETHPIVWLDSPRRRVWAGWWQRRFPAVEAVHPRITRLRTPGPPGFSRGFMRRITALLQRGTLVRNLKHCTPRAIVIANPLARFPREIRGPRVLYVTDDWIAGAALLGYPEEVLRAALVANIRAADAVAGVTPALVHLLERNGLPPRIPRAVLPNGAPSVVRYPDRRRQPVAGVIGQLNERLDLPSLEAVVEAGIPLRFIGPRTDSTDEFGQRLDRLLARPGVEWLGPVGTQRLAEELAEIRVGLTPYADTAFNRASFPLKSLEYLAAGLAVVSTDLSASRWLDSPHVVATESADTFVAAVRHKVTAELDPEAEADRVALAARHGWPERARQLLGLIEQTEPAGSK